MTDAALSNQNENAAARPSEARAHIIAWTIGLVPTIMLLTTWGEHLSFVQKLSRFFFLPAVAAEVAIILIWFREGLNLRRPPAFVLAALFGLIAIAWAGAIGSGSRYSLIQTYMWMIHILFGMAIANLAAREESLGRHLVTAMLGGFLLFALLFGLYVATRYGTHQNWYNDVPGFGNIRWFGFYADAIVGFCAWGWLQGRKGYSLIAVLALAMALWTGSRAPLAAVVGGYLVACLFFPFARRGWLRFLAIVAGALLLAALATWLVPLGGLRLLTDMGDSGRIDLWTRAAYAIAERPWFGWGDGMFADISAPLKINHPHNVILQILFAWGAIGAVLAALLVTWLAVPIYRAADDRGAPFLLAALILAAASLVDGTLYFAQSTSIFFLCVAVLKARSHPSPA